MARPAMTLPRAESAPRSRAAAFVALTKPRIIELLLVTTVPTMIVARRGWPAPWLVVPNVGWTAVTGRLAWAPVVLFAIIFYWTPPHFWALAVKYRDDYTAANVPMLPSVASLAVTAKRILLYTLLLWSVSLLFVPIGQMGVIYLVAAVVLGAIFTAMAIQLTRETTTAVAMRLFSWSITYVALLFGAMALDQLVKG